MTTFKSPKSGTFQPTSNQPIQKPAFTPGIPNGPFAPPDQIDRNVGGQIGLLNTEKDIKGIQKVGI